MPDIKPQLPPELIDRVIDHLHNSSSGLRTCALVCRAWLASSRFHLFYTIHIHPTFIRKNDSDGSSRCNKLYDAIQQSPHISVYVRELSFTIDYYDPALLSDPILPPLLQSFGKLQKLDLSALIAWDDLTDVLRSSFCSILALPSLIHFEANGLDFIRSEQFIRLLHPHLKRLAMHITWRNLVTLPAHDRQPCHLTHLKLSGRFTDWLFGTREVDISNVHTLDIVSRHPQDSCARLLTSLGQSLKHLTIRHDGFLYERAPSFSFF
jgi:hypothetical protein